MVNLSTEDTVTFLEDLIAQNKGDVGRLRHILNSIKNNKVLAKSDKQYLEEKVEQEYTADETQPPEQSIDFISKLVSEGFGDSNRLRYILHSLKQGKTIHASDKNYLDSVTQSYYAEVAQKKSSESTTVSSTIDEEHKQKQSELDALKRLTKVHKLNFKKVKNN